MLQKDTEGTLHLIVMRGLPKSGKSTKAKDLARLYGCPVVSRDAMRLAVHGTRFLEDLEGEVKEAAGLALKCLAFGGNDVIVVDECHPLKDRTVQWLTSLFDGYDKKVKLYWEEISTSRKVCIERALKDKQEDLVPVINSMADVMGL